MWVVSASVNKGLHEGPPVHYVTRRGRQVLQWKDPRQPDLLPLPDPVEAAPAGEDAREAGQDPREADVRPSRLPASVGELVPLGADPQAGRAAEEALRALLAVLLDPVAAARLAHAIRGLLSLRP